MFPIYTEPRIPPDGIPPLDGSVNISQGSYIGRGRKIYPYS